MDAIWASDVYSGPSTFEVPLVPLPGSSNGGFTGHRGFQSEMVFWVVVSKNCYFHPYLGKWSNLTNIFQMGWNHQLVLLFLHPQLNNIIKTLLFADICIMMSCSFKHILCFCSCLQHTSTQLTFQDATSIRLLLKERSPLKICRSFCVAWRAQLLLHVRCCFCDDGTSSKNGLRTTGALSPKITWSIIHNSRQFGKKCCNSGISWFSTCIFLHVW